MTGDYKGLQWVTRGYKRLQGVTAGYKGLQRVTILLVLGCLTLELAITV